MGFHDARLTGSGPDAGIDVVSSRAVAQVKARVGQAGRQDVQALIGAAHGRDGQALFFSMGGYSSPAVDYANEVGAALFTFGYDGSVEAHNAAAADLLRAAAGLRKPILTPSSAPLVGVAAIASMITGIMGFSLTPAIGVPLLLLAVWLTARAISLQNLR